MADTAFRARSAILLVLVLLTSTNSVLLYPDSDETVTENLQPEWVRFDVKKDVYFDAAGTLDASLMDEQRQPLAIGPFGTFDTNGLRLAQPVPSQWLEPRFDLLLLLVSNEQRLHEVRAELSDVEGLAVREFIAPSGLLVQGTPTALENAERHPSLLASHAVPLGMLVDGDLLDVALLTGGEEALENTLIRLDGWKPSCLRMRTAGCFVRRLAR